jgi:hypothetical protein
MSSLTSILSLSLSGECKEVEPLALVTDEPWDCLPASRKSKRTTNPIRAIVDTIVAIQSAEARGDGKHLISLAVRSKKQSYSATDNQHFSHDLSPTFLLLFSNSWEIQQLPVTSLRVQQQSRQSKTSWPTPPPQATFPPVEPTKREKPLPTFIPNPA